MGHSYGLYGRSRRTSLLQEHIEAAQWTEVPSEAPLALPAPPTALEKAGDDLRAIMRELS